MNWGAWREIPLFCSTAFRPCGLLSYDLTAPHFLPCNAFRPLTRVCLYSATSEGRLEACLSSLILLRCFVRLNWKMCSLGITEIMCSRCVGK
jgi:hypothetical protein